MLEPILLKLTVELMLCESVTKLLRELWSSRHLRRPLTLNAPIREPLFWPILSRSVKVSAASSSVDPAGTGGRGGRRWVVLTSDFCDLCEPVELSLRLRTNDLDDLGRLGVEDDELYFVLDESAACSEESSGTWISPMVSMRSSSEPNDSSSSSPKECDSRRARRTLERSLERLLAGMV